MVPVKSVNMLKQGKINIFPLVNHVAVATYIINKL